MILKMLKTDVYKKKTFTFILFLFIFLAAFLVSSSFNMLTELIASLNNLFVQTNAPHFVQMHEGSIDKERIEKWIFNNNLIKNYQLVEMLLINTNNIFFNNEVTSEKESVMNIDFVKQNELFDFLVNLDGKVIRPISGQIAIPIYYMKRNGLKIGDKLIVKNQNFEKKFTIVDFSRDVQMNPAIVHSKRFLVNINDFETIKRNISKKSVYLLEFQLNYLKYLSDFTRLYSLSNLPQNGPTVDFHLYKVLNFVTDGIVIAMIIFVSILLALISILSLRFTLLATIEEEYKQIGVMKIIGIPKKSLKIIYLIKYLFIAGLACLLGYIASLFFNQIFVSNIELYIGHSPNTIIQYVFSFFSVFLLFLTIIITCLLVLRRFNSISGVDALKSIVSKDKTNNSYLTLKNCPYSALNIFLGIKDIFHRLRLYLLIFFVFIICSFVIILSLNFFNTIKSNDFMTYLGVGQSHIRIDLRAVNHIDKKLKEISSYLTNDREVEKFSPLVTARFKLKNDNGQIENIDIETGNFSIFPLRYLYGSSPSNNNEISLSYLNSKRLHKEVGDSLYLILNGQDKKMRVSGIYQDITNGGKTAKAILTFNPESILWCVINVNLVSKDLLNSKVKEYSNVFYPIHVTDLNHYMHETLGDLINQIKTITTLSIVIAVFIAILITSLFLKMLIVKDYSQIALMKAIGFSLNAIRLQYLAKLLFILNLGIITGVIVSNTLGMKLVSMIWSFIGAPKIQFIINPIQVYVICPAILMFIVSVTTFISIRLIKDVNIRTMILE